MSAENRKPAVRQNIGDPLKAIPRRIALEDRWRVLCAEFPNDERLNCDVIYALPFQLLDLIAKHAPGLLTAEDQQFERRLRELAGTGFRAQRAFGCELLDSSDSEEVSQELFGEPVDQMFRKFRLTASSALAPEVTRRESLKETREKLQRRTAQRLQGFAGWLVTNPAFRRESTRLSDEWARHPELVFAPPDLELLVHLYNGELNGRRLKQLSQLISLARQFLRRWNLVRMQTWELPVPISPVQITDDPLPKNEMTSMGVSVFIPWSLLADRDMKLDDVVDFHRNRQDLSHLEGWTSSGRSKSWGVARHAEMLTLFIYLECAIKIRYSKRLYGNVGNLDLAFRAFWGPRTADGDALKVASESARKIREELQRRLKRILDADAD